MEAIGQQGAASAQPREVQIAVNERPVLVSGSRTTGLRIKEAAISQGVPIQIDFVLSEELRHGNMRIVGDTDEVAVHKHSRFNAIAPDDNS